MSIIKADLDAVATDARLLWERTHQLIEERDAHTEAAEALTSLLNFYLHGGPYTAWGPVIERPLRAREALELSATAGDKSPRLVPEEQP